MIAQPCGCCGGTLIVWSYTACDEDTMFNPNAEKDPDRFVPLVMVEGHGEMQKRAALLCSHCDRVDCFPRRES